MKIKKIIGIITIASMMVLSKTPPQSTAVPTRSKCALLRSLVPTLPLGAQLIP